MYNHTLSGDSKSWRLSQLPGQYSKKGYVIDEKELAKKKNEIGCKFRVSKNEEIKIGYNQDIIIDGISENAAELLSKNDFQSALQDCMKYHWFDVLSGNRKRAVGNMMFNLGVIRFSRSIRIIKSLKPGF